jgi:hypothetical protein
VQFLDLAGPDNDPVRDWIASNQLTADAWYVANPNLTAETRRLEKVGRAVDELLDKVVNCSTRLGSRSG